VCSEFPVDIYSTEQVRELDRLAIEEHGIGGYDLMQRAGHACFQSLLEAWPQTRRIRVYCGAGNNGGDGYVIARLAVEAGLAVEVIPVGDAQAVKGDARQAREDWLPYDTGQVQDQVDVIVDAIFGTGLSRPPAGKWLQCIEEINQANAAVLSVDIPSGLDSDTGMPKGENAAVVFADRTLTFIGMKQGLLTGKAGDYSGVLLFDSLGLPDSLYRRVMPVAERLHESLLLAYLPSRLPSAHKGNHGHALLIGGAPGMQGAIHMAAEACARTGAGLTTMVSHDGGTCRPEIMTCASSDHARLSHVFERANVIAIGPGLGLEQQAKTLLAQSLQQHKRMVVDADGLWLLSDSGKYRGNWVLTPHPGEAACLLRTSTQQIQQDRFAAVRDIQRKYGGVCVLKGFGSLIYDGESMSVCTAGNPGMGTGGMGDVLTGVIAGLLAQGLKPYDAARLGTYIHARAADLAAASFGERGLLATDLYPYIRMLVNPGKEFSGRAVLAT